MLTEEYHQDKVCVEKVYKIKEQSIVILTFKTDVLLILRLLVDVKDSENPLTEIFIPDLCNYHY